jgi:hypothetical protein
MLLFVIKQQKTIRLQSAGRSANMTQSLSASPTTVSTRTLVVEYLRLVSEYLELKQYESKLTASPTTVRQATFFMSKNMKNGVEYCMIKRQRKVGWKSILSYVPLSFLNTLEMFPTSAETLISKKNHFFFLSRKKNRVYSTNYSET